MRLPPSLIDIVFFVLCGFIKPYIAFIIIFLVSSLALRTETPPHVYNFFSKEQT